MYTAKKGLLGLAIVGISCFACLSLASAEAAPMPAPAPENAAAAVTPPALPPVAQPAEAKPLTVKTAPVPLAAEEAPNELLLFGIVPEVVTASKREESSLTAPGLVYVITAEEIKRFGWRTLREALKSLPNIDEAYTYQYSKIGQNGFFGNGSDTLMLIDGRPSSNLNSDQAWINNTFLLEKVKRIEILQGPCSTLYGGNAMEGVINIITKTGAEGKNDPDFGEAKVTLGDGGRYQYEGSFKVKKDDAMLGGSVSYFSAMNNWTKLQNFAVDHQDYGRTSYDKLRDPVATDVSIPEEEWAINLYAEYKGLYAGVNTQKMLASYGQEYDYWGFQDNTADRAVNRQFIGYNYKFSENLKANLEYMYTHAPELNLIANAASNTATATSFNNLQRKFFYSGNITDAHEVKGNVQYDLNTQNSLIVGFDRAYRGDSLKVTQDFDAAGAERLTRTKDGTDKLDIFGQDVYQFLNNLKAILGVNYNKQSGVADSFTPRGSLIYQPTKESSLEAVYGAGFRGPSRSELGNYIGNVNGYSTSLKPQSMDDMELDYKHSFGIVADLNAFNQLRVYKMDALNLITSQTSTTGGIVTTQNTGKTIRGVEDQLKFSSGSFNGFIGGRYIMPDKVTIDGQDIVLDVPVWKAKLGLGYKFIDWLEASLLVDHSASTQIDAPVYDPANTYPAGWPTEVYTIPAWTSLDLNINVGEFVLNGGVKFLFAFYVENLLDQDHYEASWAANGAGPIEFMMPPRNYRASATLTF
jgi:outer membrane receptor protein involved in Fe transport